MTKKYTIPDFNMDIEVLRAEIRRDYDALCKRYSLSPKFNFDMIVSAVKNTSKGIDVKSPYARMQGEIIDLISHQCTEDNEEINDAFEVLTGIWNYFPHDSLDGLAPIEKMMENKNSKHNIILQSINDSDTESYWTLIDKEVLAFSGTAENNLYEYMKKLGCNKNDLKNIINILSDPEGDPSNATLYLMRRFSDLAEMKKNGITINSIPLVIRAITQCENYIASEMPNGYYNSRMFQYIAEQVMKYNEAVIEETKKQKGAKSKITRIFEPLSSFQSLAMIHNAINDFCSDLDADIGIKESAMHITDWLAMTDIFDLLERTDLNETALYIIGAACFIAETGNPKKPYKLLNNKLRKLLKDYGIDDDCYNSEIARLAEKAICNSIDPIMMMPYPGEAPADCNERLMSIAPCLKFRPLSNSFTF